MGEYHCRSHINQQGAVIERPYHAPLQGIRNIIAGDAVTKPSQLDDLWGATLDRADLDIVRQALALTIRISSSSGDTVHTLACSGLLELRFFNAIPDPWEYAEVTEIQANDTPSGAHQIEIALWSEEAGLMVSAETITLDGERIAG